MLRGQCGGPSGGLVGDPGNGVLEDILELAESLGDDGVDQCGTALLSFLLCECCRSGAGGCETSVCGLCQPCDFFTIRVGGLGQLRCE